MRRVCVLMSVGLLMLAASLSARSAGAQAPTPIDASPSSDEAISASGDQWDGEAGCDERGGRGHGGRGGCGGKGCGEGGCGKNGCGGGRNANRWFNCNCNGSYKFPVPPLYTYHWPGLYSMQRMTDYHSPWRFPAIKPYEDETPVRDLSRRPEFRQTSAGLEVRATDDYPSEDRVSRNIARHYADE